MTRWEVALLGFAQSVSQNLLMSGVLAPKGSVTARGSRVLY